MINRYDQNAHVEYRNAWQRLADLKAGEIISTVAERAAVFRLNACAVAERHLAWDPLYLDWDDDLLAEQEACFEHKLRLIRAELEWRRAEMKAAA